MEDCADEETNYQLLPTFLQLPDFRLGRYVFLLEKYLKRTKPNHPDYPHLTGAIAKIKAFIALVSEAKANFANTKRATGFKDTLDLSLEENEIFVHEGTLIERKEENGVVSSSVYVHPIIFSETLIWATLTKDGKYEKKHTMKIKDVTLESLPDTAMIQYAFRFTHTHGKMERKFYVSSNRKQEKVEWFDKFNETKKAVIDKENEKRANAEALKFIMSRASIGVPDANYIKNSGGVRLSQTDSNQLSAADADDLDKLLDLLKQDK